MAKRTEPGEMQGSYREIEQTNNQAKPSRRRRKPAPEITSHTWSRTSVLLAINQKNGGPPRRRVEFKLAPLRLSRDALLRCVLQSAPFPVHGVYAYSLRSSLKALERNAAAMRILRSSISQVTPHEIKELFQYIEDSIQNQNINQHAKSLHTRAIFQFCSFKLADGSLIKDFRFQSRFSNPSTQMGMGRPLKSPKNQTTPDLTPLKFDSLQERNEKALDFGISIRDKVIQLCEHTLNQHEEVLKKILEARNKGFPPSLKDISKRAISNGRPIDPEIYSRLSSDELFQLAAILGHNTSWALKTRLGYFPFKRIEKLHEYCFKPTGASVLEVLLSEYMLPSLVVTACAITILAFTAINSEVITKMTLSNILERGNHIFFIGIKGKSGQLIEGSFAEDSNDTNELDDKLRINNPIAIKALRLLIENAKKIEAYSGNTATPLLSVLDKTTRHTSWEPINFYQALNVFWDYHNVNQISPRDLRRLCAHIVLLSPGETIFSVQVLLGHENINTTIEYVNTNIIAQLLDANISRFGEKLAATALFATNRAGELKTRGLNKDDIQPLLFPVSKFSTEKCTADNWIESSGELCISLGIAEVRHCATQYRYYRDNFDKLLNENPRRFSLVHLPRIFFCYSLRKVLLSSPHCSLYKKLEEE